MENKYWFSIELSIDEAELFQEYMREQGIKFEPSAAYDLIHMQCLMDENECMAANAWLKNIRLVN